MKGTQKWSWWSTNQSISKCNDTSKYPRLWLAARSFHCSRMQSSSPTRRRSTFLFHKDVQTSNLSLLHRKDSYKHCRRTSNSRDWPTWRQVCQEAPQDVPSFACYIGLSMNSITGQRCSMSDAARRIGIRVLAVTSSQSHHKSDRHLTFFFWCVDMSRYYKGRSRLIT